MNETSKREKTHLYGASIIHELSILGKVLLDAINFH
jgi:hypothetical protein